MPKVFIGIGHGGVDDGACANGIKEDEINLVMGLKLASELSRHGIIVGISRTTDETDKLAEEISECNAFAPDVAIEIHNNAGGGIGFEVFRQTGTYKAQSISLANAIETRIKEMGQKSRGVKYLLNSSGTDYYGWLRQTKCPAVLCEGAFLDNATDVQMINTKEKQEKFSVAYAKGILDYFGLKYSEDTSQCCNECEEIKTMLVDAQEELRAEKTAYAELEANYETALIKLEQIRKIVE